MEHHTLLLLQNSTFSITFHVPLKISIGIPVHERTFLYCSLSAASEESMSNSSNCEQRINKFPFVDQQLKYLP